MKRTAISQERAIIHRPICINLKPLLFDKVRNFHDGQLNEEPYKTIATCGISDLFEESVELMWPINSCGHGEVVLLVMLWNLLILTLLITQNKNRICAEG